MIIVKVHNSQAAATIISVKNWLLLKVITINLTANIPKSTFVEAVMFLGANFHLVWSVPLSMGTCHFHLLVFVFATVKAGDCQKNIQIGELMRHFDTNQPHLHVIQIVYFLGVEHCICRSNNPFAGGSQTAKSAHI